MKFIFTKEDRKTVRKQVENFRQSYIIDAREIILPSDYVDTGVITTAQDFISNNEVEKRLLQAMNNKKSTQVIYFHYSITGTLVKNVKAFFRANGAKFEYILFDPGQEFKPIYRLFDEIQP